MSKERADVLLVEQGFFSSREQAKRAIMEGIVYDQHGRVDKPGTKIDTKTEFSVKGQTLKYVSRGGLKLEKALHTFQLSLEGKIMLDIGSSTGGFTDCALQNGASLVYALDVGTNQLVWKLRSDPRVVVMEKTNFRYATPDMFHHGLPSFTSIDVSFISLKHIFPPLSSILVSKGDIVALIKPQFEAGKEEVGKKGIVREPSIHEKVIQNVKEYAESVGFGLKSLTFSPITGGEGNIEFLAHFIKDEPSNTIDITEVVTQAHETFKK